MGIVCEENGFNIRLYHGDSIQIESLDALLLILKHLPTELIQCIAIWTTDKAKQLIICEKIFELCMPNMIHIGSNKYHLVERLLQSKGYNMPGGNWIKVEKH
jgi:hypothetical protein